MARRRLENNVEDVELDMTPMLDVVFILLIFFIVTAVFVKEPGVKVHKPLWESSELDPEKPTIIVAVAADSKVWINKKIVPLNAVKTELGKMKIENPKAEGVIRGDDKAKIGIVLDVQDDFDALKIPVKVSVENN